MIFTITRKNAIVVALTISYPLLS